MTGYAAAAHIYLRAGWRGPLPLPPGRKGTPPEGYTGWHGDYPSGADVQAWFDDDIVYRGTGQIGLRMDDTVIGIDVDHYGIKRGADTLAEAQRRWGPLPPAPISSARGDGPSGIRFYRVPPGTHLRTVIRFAATDTTPALGHIEIIQLHHRYAVVWPSTNPDAEPLEDGTQPQYVWRHTAGPDQPPQVDRLNYLPDRWLEELRGSDEPGVAEATPEQVTAFNMAHVGSNRLQALAGVEAVLRDYLATGMARHDAIVSVACMAAREAVLGYYPALDAMARLRTAFVRCLAAAGSGQRLVAATQARAEFSSVWAWAVSQAMAETDVSLAERARGTVERQSGMFADEPKEPNNWEKPVIATPRENPQRSVTQGEMLAPSTVDQPAPAAAPLPVPPPLSLVPPLPVGAPLPSAPVTQLLDQPVQPVELDENGLTPEQAAEVVQRMLDSEIAVQRRKRDAREALAAERREPLRRMSLKQFMASPAPEYIVPRMLYRDGISVVFGPEGSAKSFLCLDIALCRATGQKWQGHDIGKGRVYYVMAEGQATNTLRTHAWFARHADANIDTADEMFTAFPMPVLLTEPGIAQLLREVEHDRPDMIIFDTKNLMFAGKESAGEDAGAMLRVLHQLRQAAGGCCIVLVDHTGLFDDTRARGGNGQRAGTETEIRVVEQDGRRLVFCTRDKSAEYDSTKPLWAFRLEQVPEVPRPVDVSAPAVCVPCAVQESDQFVLTPASVPEWTDALKLPPLPADVMDWKGKGKAALPWLARHVRHADIGGAGISRVDAVRALSAAFRSRDGKKPLYSRDTIERAWDALILLGRISKLGNDVVGRSEWVAKDGDPT